MAEAQTWQVLLRWNVQRGVPVIPRSNTPANIEGNAKGLFDWALTESQKVRAYQHGGHAPKVGARVGATGMAQDEPGTAEVFACAPGSKSRSMQFFTQTSRMKS